MTAPAPDATRSRRTLLIVLAGLALLVVAGVVAVQLRGSGTPAGPQPAEPVEIRIIGIGW